MDETNHELNKNSLEDSKSRLDALKNKLAEKKQEQAKKVLSDDEFAKEVAEMALGNINLNNIQEKKGGNLEYSRSVIEKRIEANKKILQTELIAKENLITETGSQIKEAEALLTEDDLTTNEEIKALINDLNIEKEALKNDIEFINKQSEHLNEEKEYGNKELDHFVEEQKHFATSPYTFAVDNIIESRSSLKESLKEEDSNENFDLRQPVKPKDMSEAEWIGSIEDRAKEINEIKVFSKKVDESVKKWGSFEINNPASMEALLKKINQECPTNLSADKKTEIISSLIFNSSQEDKYLNKKLSENNKKLQTIDFIKQYPADYENIQKQIKEIEESVERVKAKLSGSEDEIGKISKSIDYSIDWLKTYPRREGWRNGESLVSEIKNDSFNKNEFGGLNKSSFLSHVRAMIPFWQGVVNEFSKRLTQLESTLSNDSGIDIKDINSKVAKLYGSDEVIERIETRNMVNHSNLVELDERKPSISNTEKMIKEEEISLVEKKSQLAEKAKAFINYYELKNLSDNAKRSNDYSVIREKEDFDKEKVRYLSERDRAIQALTKSEYYMSLDYEINNCRLSASDKVLQEDNSSRDLVDKLIKDRANIYSKIRAKELAKKEQEQADQKIRGKFKNLFKSDKDKPDYDEEIKDLEKRKGELSKSIEKASDTRERTIKIIASAKNVYGVSAYSAFERIPELKGIMKVDEYLDKIKEITSNKIAEKFPEDKQKIVDQFLEIENKLKLAEEEYNKYRQKSN
ncbi:MAG: hypothetical protein NTY12_00290 [Candidatus Falkowbacteria bacterium]|nr:hypothetical protein [Candidatus Falkowbacteria bacterium]